MLKGERTPLADAYGLADGVRLILGRETVEEHGALGVTVLHERGEGQGALRQGPLTGGLVHHVDGEAFAAWLSADARLGVTPRQS
jgi:hypothetical protein